MKGKAGSVPAGVEDDGSCRNRVISKVKTPSNAINPKNSEIKAF